jgi:hypothetical protein
MNSHQNQAANRQNPSRCHPTSLLSPDLRAHWDLMGQRDWNKLNYYHDDLPLLKRSKDYREGNRQIWRDFKGQFYGVFNFNLKELTPEWCRPKLNFFDMKVAERLLGKNWSREPASRRCNWLAQPEWASYLHYNSIWDVPVEFEDKFFSEAPGLWAKIVHEGQFCVQRIRDREADAQSVREYCCKVSHPRWSFDHLVHSSEFRNKK